MSCDLYRVELSARLDGEDDPALRQAVDEHLGTCAECAGWWQRAGAVTKLARTAAALPGPTLGADAVKAILDAAPAAAKPVVRKITSWLRLALLAVGLGQFFLGVAQISAYATTQAEHGPGGGIASVSSGHLWHESAAWNVAIGAALAWLAWRRTRPAGLLPVMTAFVAVLALLTANDALAGRVDGDRILSHSLVLAGYGLLLLMNHPRLRDTPPPARSLRPHSGWTIGTTAGTGDDNEGPSATVYPFPARASMPIGIRRRGAA